MNLDREKLKTLRKKRREKVAMTNLQQTWFVNSEKKKTLKNRLNILLWKFFMNFFFCFCQICIKFFNVFQTYKNMKWWNWGTVRWTHKFYHQVSKFDQQIYYFPFSFNFSNYSTNFLTRTLENFSSWLTTDRF